MRCIAVINQKGGVGKTTTTVNLGAAFAQKGHRVLLLDIDPQANLTLHLDRRPEGDSPTMTDLLVDDTPLREIICETSTEGLYMVPADTSLSGVETQLANRIGRETILREALELAADDEQKFDYVFLDCPPSLGVLSANALVAAERVIIPMQAEYFSMQGMTKLMEVMDLVRKSLNPTIEISLILPCMVDRRTNLTNEVLSELRRHFGDVLANTCVRSNVKLAEAPSFGRTIFEHAPDSNGARDYVVVADELLHRLEGTFEMATIEEPEEEVKAVELVVAGESPTEPRREDQQPEVAAPVAESKTDAPAETLEPTGTEAPEAANNAAETIVDVPVDDSYLAAVSNSPDPEPPGPDSTADNPSEATVTTSDHATETPPAIASATDIPILLPPVPAEETPSQTPTPDDPPVEPEKAETEVASMKPTPLAEVPKDVEGEHQA